MLKVSLIDRTANGPRTLRKSPRSYSNNICFNYQNHGRCHFGKRCRFLHTENDHFNSKPRHGENRYANFNKQNNFNSRYNFKGVDNTNVQNNFLEEINVGAAEQSWWKARSSQGMPWSFQVSNLKVSSLCIYFHM